MYREENAMVCIIYAPDGLPEAFNDYISGKKFIGKIDHIFIGNSIEEVNNLIEKWNWLSNYVVQTDDRRTYDRSYVCGLSERKALKAIRLLNG